MENKIYISWDNGEMTIDLAKFIERRNINDIKYLGNKILKICNNKSEVYRCCNEIIHKIYNGEILFKPTMGTLTLEEGLHFNLKEAKYIDKKCKRLQEQLDKYCAPF